MFLVHEGHILFVQEAKVPSNSYFVYNEVVCITSSDIDTEAVRIKVEKTKEESYRTQWNDNGDYQRVPYMATRTTIKSVDNNDG